MLEKIIAYIENRMSAKERADFEQQLAADEQLRQETELLKDTLLGVELFGDENLRNSLTNIEKDLEKQGFLRAEATIKPLPRRNFTTIYWAAAASLIGVVSCVWYFWQQPTQPQIVAPTPTIEEKQNAEPTIIVEKETPKLLQKEEKINLSEQEMQAKYAKYLAIAEENYALETASIFSTERNTDEVPEKVVIDSVFQLIKQKKYQKAASLLEKSTFSPKYDAKIKFLKAHTYFLAKKYPSARAYFKALVDNGKTIYTEEAEYYLLLCYLTDYQRLENNFNDLSSKIMIDKEHAFYENTQKTVRKVTRITNN